MKEKTRNRTKNIRKARKAKQTKKHETNKKNQTENLFAVARDSGF